MAKPYLLGLYEKSMPQDYSLRHKLELACQANYDYLELSIDESDEKITRLDWSSAEVNALRRDIEETGLPIKSICLSAHRRCALGDPDPAVREQSLSVMEKAVALADAVGIRLIQLAGYDVYYKSSTDETRRLFGQNLALAVEMAARRGVVLAFETMETPFMDTVEKALTWVLQINSPYLQIYPDLGNLTNAAALYDSNVRDDLLAGHGHLAALHLKETSPGIYREVAYGDGHVNFDTGVRTAWQLGVRLFVGEFWYLGEQDVLETLRSNCTFLRSVLNRSC